MVVRIKGRKIKTPNRRGGFRGCPPSLPSPPSMPGMAGWLATARLPAVVAISYSAVHGSYKSRIFACSTIVTHSCPSVYVPPRTFSSAMALLQSRTSDAIACVQATKSPHSFSASSKPVMVAFSWWMRALSACAFVLALRTPVSTALLCALKSALTRSLPATSTAAAIISGARDDALCAKRSASCRAPEHAAALSASAAAKPGAVVVGLGAGGGSRGSILLDMLVETDAEMGRRGEVNARYYF